ncbi:MAG: hypothetical protein K2X47_18645 [Bdellovibrionales bacterium]|nr:hypothetical protein [Bdellovibrionales bacterium]
MKFLCFVLSILFLFLSHSAQAEGVSWIKEWAVGAELGAGVSGLISDASTGLLAVGMGKGIGLSASTRASQEMGLKIRLDQIWLKEWAVGASQFSEYTTAYRVESFERSYSILGVGVEGRRNEDHAIWVWDATLGFAFTGGGEVGLQPKAASVSQIESRSLSARSQFGVGASYGYRRKLDDKWSITTSLRTFLIVPPIFEGPMGVRFVFGLPLLFSFSVERLL